MDINGHIITVFLLAVIAAHSAYTFPTIEDSFEKIAARFEEATLAAREGHRNSALWALKRLASRTESIIKALEGSSTSDGREHPFLEPKSPDPRRSETENREVPKSLHRPLLEIEGEPKDSVSAVWPGYPAGDEPKSDENIGILPAQLSTENLNDNRMQELPSMPSAALTFEIEQESTKKAKREITAFEQKVETLREAYRKAISSLESVAPTNSIESTDKRNLVSDDGTKKWIEDSLKHIQEAGQRFEEIQKFVKEAIKYSSREKEVSEYFQKVYEWEMKRTKTVLERVKDLKEDEERRRKEQKVPESSKPGLEPESKPEKPTETGAEDDKTLKTPKRGETDWVPVDKSGSTVSSPKQGTTSSKYRKAEVEENLNEP